MRLRVSFNPRRTEDWDSVVVVTDVEDLVEDGLGEHLIQEIQSVEVYRNDGSVIQDLDGEDLEAIMNDLDYDMLQAIISEEYLYGEEY